MQLELNRLTLPRTKEVLSEEFRKVSSKTKYHAKLFETGYRDKVSRDWLTTLLKNNRTINGTIPPTLKTIATATQLKQLQA